MGNVEEITSALEKEINDQDLDVSTDEVGHVVEVADGIARISGLDDCMSQEQLEFESGVTGLALNLNDTTVGAIVIGDYSDISEGDTVKRTGEILSVPVGEELVGRVVDSLGESIDDGSDIETEDLYPVESSAPGVMDRQPVEEPLHTGIKAIDAMVPIGRGQRELIVGDRQTGKTTVAVDTILNQKDSDVYCIYVAIGQKRSSVARLVGELEDEGAMEYTTVVAATASDGAARQYIAPYAATAQAEYLMNQGEDVLIVYDDLSKHAVAYREISLLLRRPPGRQAYPGDVFYLHSRLLERSAKLHEDLGGGSITSLPIIETKAGNVSAYIPTNVISITDGQIYLESELFNKGVRPAINTGNSVSRVGSAAQLRGMKKAAGQVRTQMAQFRELQAFTQFSSDLDEDTKKRLDKGLRIREILKQPQSEPVDIGVQIILFYAVREGYISDVPVEEVNNLETELREHLEASHEDLLTTVTDKWDDEVIEEVEKVLESFMDMRSTGDSNESGE